jgi:hypothetical protein
MGRNVPDAVGADAILRQLDAEAGHTSIEVTLYLPWGVATGITVPSTYFGHYVAHFFSKNDAEDIAGRLAALEAEQDRVFLHLRKAKCYVGGEVEGTTRFGSGGPMCRLGRSPAWRSSADHAVSSLSRPCTATYGATPTHPSWMGVRADVVKLTTAGPSPCRPITPPAQGRGHQRD